MKIKVLSLFDGLAGARLALHNLGINCEYCASEIDKYAIQIAQKNFPDTIQVGDINELDFSQFKDINLIIGGSPCQDLSIAKKNRKGLKGKKSNLFWKFVEAIKIIKPKYFLLENVNSMNKESKKIITEILKVEPIMINSALLTAQNRKRLYWCNWNVRQPKDRHIYLKDILQKRVEEKYFLTNLQLSKLDLTKIKDLLKRTWLCGKHQQDIIQNSLYKSSTIPAGTHASTPHLLKTLLIHKLLPNKSCCIDANYYKGTTLEHYLKKNVRQLIYNQSFNFKKANTLGSNPQCRTAKTGQELFDFKNEIIRRLTPIECERLQGIPDNYTMGVSNTQRYKMIGNGFTISVIEHLLKPILKNE